MELSQLVLLLTLVRGGEASGREVGPAADVSAAVREDPDRERSESRVPAHRTLPPASEREQLGAGSRLGRRHIRADTMNRHVHRPLQRLPPGRSIVGRTGRNMANPARESADAPRLDGRPGAGRRRRAGCPRGGDRDPPVGRCQRDGGPFRRGGADCSAVGAPGCTAERHLDGGERWLLTNRSGTSTTGGTARRRRSPSLQRSRPRIVRMYCVPDSRSTWPSLSAFWSSSESRPGSTAVERRAARRCRVGAAASPAHLSFAKTMW
jgi:hypothetical protein